jgi:YD repeat-containing protein
VEEYTGTEGLGTFTHYATTTYQYDPLGNLLHTTDISNNVTSMVYDPLSRKTSMTDPDMGAWSYVYDDNGNLTYQTDAKGQTINFTYDKLNRVTQKTYVGSTTTPVVYTYDEASSDNPKGRLTTVTDASGSTQFSYDERGRTKSTIKTIDGTPYTIQTRYDSRDRVKSITYPGSSPETVSYVYNTAGNLTNVRSSVSPDYAVYTGFNAFGQAGEVQYGNGVYTTYTYDITSTRLTDLATMGTTTLQNLHYDYDNVGNIEALTDRLDSNKTQNFYYDELNRLVEADSPVYGTIAYRYDTIGNMIFNSRVGSYAYTDPLHAHAVTQAGTNSYAYDADGNMTGGEGRTFVWNYDNRPTSINGVAMCYLAHYSE